MIGSSAVIAVLRALVVLSAIFSFISNGFAQTNTLEAVKARGKLIVGVRADLPPWGTMTKEGQFEGFDVDVFQYFAKTLGVQLEMRQATSQTMIPLLQTGAIDVGPSSAPSVKREESVDFSIVAAWDSAKILVAKKSGIARRPEKDNLYQIKSFALVHGTFWGTIAQKKYPGAEIIWFQQYPEAVLAVKLGKAEATVLALSGSAQILRDNPDLELLEKPLALDATAYPIRENDSKWRKWINTTLQVMWKEKKLQEAYRKHYHADPFFSMWSQFMLQPGMD
jgi:polar amino acid transport system substrate-binding protein